MIGIYHGWGGTKLGLTGTDAQRALARGYAVFTMTDRGWGGSCGAAMRTDPRCVGKGYIRLMHNAYEVRDAQYALGQLADDGVIDPQRIGATGGSYGGGMSIALGALSNRTQLPDGSLVPWTSPLGKPMRIAATVPEFTWSDIAYALTPNGSIARLRRRRALSRRRAPRRRAEAELEQLALPGGPLLGYYAPLGSDPSADIMGWKALTDTGGPFDANPAAAAMVAELTANHSAYYLDDSIAPAPALLANGWNDDLFPVDESLRYYNKVRAKYPNTPISMFHLDFGHSPRAGAISAADRAALTAAENAWLDYYVKGVGPEPADARGGVDILTSKCPVSAAGTRYHAPTWAQLAPGEIRLDGAAAQTIAAPGTAPSNAFTSGDVCTTTSSADNASAATYRVPAATTAYTLAGSPTIIAKLTVTGANDMVAARLYDVDGATAAADRARRAAPARRRRRADRAGLPAAPAGLDRPARPRAQARAARAGLAVPAHGVSRRPAAAGDRLRPPAAAAGRRRAGPRPRQRRQRRRSGGEVPARGLQAGPRVRDRGDRRRRRHRRRRRSSLTLGAPASFGAFTPGVARDYTASTTATVISTAGDAALTVADPSDATGRLVNGDVLARPAAAGRRARAPRRGQAPVSQRERRRSTFRQASEPPIRCAPAATRRR